LASYFKTTLHNTCRKTC